MARAFLITAASIGAVASALGGGMSVVPAVSKPAAERPLEVRADAAPRQEDHYNAARGAVVLDRNANGHFYADIAVNGATVHAMVDTGASAIALSRADARNAGVATSIGMPNVVGMGADGEVHGEVVTLDRVTLGSVVAEAIPAVVLSSGEQTLLGQSFLGHFDSVEIHGDTMILK